jgi:hypothetical protein
MVTIVLQRGESDGIQGLLNCEDKEMYAKTLARAF